MKKIEYYKAILLAEIETDPAIVTPQYLFIEDNGAFAVNTKGRIGSRLAAKIKILNMYDYLLNNYGWDYADYFWNYSRGGSEKIKKYNLKEKKLPHCKCTKDGQCDLFCPYFCGKCNY